MNCSSLVVLERTLDLVIDTMSPDENPAVAEGVSFIRRHIESLDLENGAAVYHAMMKLAQLAHENRQFLIAARLEAFAREMNGDRRNHDVA